MESGTQHEMKWKMTDTGTGRIGTQTVQEKAWKPGKGGSIWLYHVQLKSARADSNWQKVKDTRKGKRMVMHRVCVDADFTGI